MTMTVLDFKGLLCPLPVLKAKKALRGVQPGEEIEVITTDPGAMEDFKCLCEEDGHELLSQVVEGDVCVHRLRKG